MVTRLNNMTYIIMSLLTFGSLGILFFLIRGFIRFFPNDYDATFWIMSLFLICLVVFCSSQINNIKYLRIKADGMLIISLLTPFGKTLYFKDFTSIYKTTETGSGGTYDVVYLVNHNNITQFKIMGLYYKNMDEIIAAIPLPVIKRNLSGREYLKLMFTGRADLSKIKDKKNTDSKIVFYFKVFSAVTILIFVIGMLIRIFSR